ncbi:hypothetical protein EIN_417710 [Entamoeba invadens IP1]|uniref:DNA-directed DNA polymerase n=1 Tax=Entamoeba invadens IP1 TaxID=370355 RepID=A0A0A1U4Z6_ENTIV|nr:hypothetical protein EIN_417710 [Entamoeba invadens IP1]ELP87952.1 hypothetical protein EIN_417710 [Entamoeba invadens IP1]|eukprot:XP_004254723.1 hypothetical protein EIN_417710 [Entamoeba invadens IP1]
MNTDKEQYRLKNFYNFTNTYSEDDILNCFTIKAGTIKAASTKINNKECRKELIAMGIETRDLYLHYKAKLEAQLKRMKDNKKSTIKLEQPFLSKVFNKLNKTDKQTFGLINKKATLIKDLDEEKIQKELDKKNLEWSLNNISFDDIEDNDDLMREDMYKKFEEELRINAERKNYFKELKEKEQYENNMEEYKDMIEEIEDHTKINTKVTYDRVNKIIKADFRCGFREKLKRIQLVREYFIDLIKSVPSTTEIVYKYLLSQDGWKTYMLNTKDAIDEFLNSVSEESMCFINKQEVNDSIDSTFYVQQTIPEPLFILELKISPYHYTEDLIHQYKTTGGSFFPYHYKPEFEIFGQYLAKAQIFSSLIDENGKVRSEFDLNCFTYALKQANVDDETLELVLIHCRGRYQKAKMLDELCKSAHIRIRIDRECTDNNKKHDKNRKIDYYGCELKDAKYNLEMFLYRDSLMKGDHYILNIDIPITPFYLKNREEINNWTITHNKSIKSMFNKQRYNKNKQCYEVKPGAKTTIKLSDLILYIRDHNGFEPYSLSDVLHLKSDLSEYVLQSLNTLEYLPFETRKIEIKENKRKEVDHSYWYADFEASTQGYHNPYCVCYSKRGEDKIYNKYGKDCAYDFLCDLPHNAVCYFHNLKYDGSFLAKYGVNRCIKKGGKIMQMTLKFKGKQLTFKDSLALITAPLSAFPKMFGLSNIQKEIYPYNYYSKDNIIHNIGNILEADLYETKQWNKDQFDLFINNIDSIEDCRIDDFHFNMELYCKFYCNQDVRILKQGHSKFRDMCLEYLNIDIDKVISAASLANTYFKHNVYSKINNLKEYGGKVREFIQGAIYGGRCMTRDNKKWYVNDELYDYDACSLYPSAINRLKLATGSPIVISENMLNNDYLLNHLMDEQQLEPTESKFISAFLVDIEITKVNKKLHFPLIVKKTKQGNKNVNELCSMRVDNILLEDLIKFQQIEYKIIRGYYWTGNKSDLLSNEMAKLYNLRRDFKKQGNPVQEVFKLIMNSSYGKTIQKPIKSELVYKQISVKNKKNEIQYDADRYLKKNSLLVKSFYDVADNIRCFETIKSFDDFFVPNLIGVQTLTMSKRIMNEVMCLAEDLNIPIYYQDTDSMHILKSRINELENEYFKKYNRVLRGSDMGQFHPDFDELSGDVTSIESYFLGKKAYCDKLTNENNEIEHHLRLKGIPNNLLNCQYEDPLELYKKLYDGESFNFNLLQLRPSFEFTKDFKIKSRSQFCRNIKFNSELGSF